MAFTNCKIRRGLGVPDLKTYHLSFLTVQSVSWLSNLDPYLTSSWVLLERNIVVLFPLPAMLTMDLKKAKISSPILSTNKNAISRLDATFSNKIIFSKKESLWNNPLIKLYTLTSCWEKWINAGIFYISCICHSNMFLFFSFLHTKYLIPAFECHWYVVLCKAILSAYISSIPDSLCSGIELIFDILFGHIASKTYNKINVCKVYQFIEITCILEYHLKYYSTQTWKKSR